jgi:polyphosphate kinase 2 (PPK2 family)
MGFASQHEVELFLNEAPVIEQMLKNNGFKIVKFWLDVSKKEQARRFKERQSNPLKLGKMSPIDRVSQDKWKEYCDAEKDIFEKTGDWIIVNSDCKRSARLACMEIVLKQNDYAGKNLHNMNAS